MKSDRYVDEGVPVIRGTNITDDRPLTGDFVFVSEETADELSSSNVFPGDLVFPHRGAIGRVAIVPGDTSQRWVLSTSLMKLTCDQAHADPRFVYYFFRSSVGKDLLLRNASSVGTPGIAQPLATLRSLRIQLPSLREQRRIANLLWAIDDLIENKRRRIEVLDEMARTVYREWFLHFRFPGHEHAAFVDSPVGPIPEGWEVRSLGSVLELKYGKALRAVDRVEGAVQVVGSSGVVGTHQTPLLTGPTIVLGRKGNVGNVSWLPGPNWPIDTTYYVETNLPLRFVREQLKRVEFINSHAAVPGLSRDTAYAADFVQPPGWVMDEFDQFATLIDAGVQNLEKSTAALAALRDLLLPKLVTGEIDVSELDLDALVEAAT